MNGPGGIGPKCPCSCQQTFRPHQLRDDLVDFKGLKAGWTYPQSVRRVTAKAEIDGRGAGDGFPDKQLRVESHDIV
jgi:hypothetical protein